jgi:hypothetical protein
MPAPLLRDECLGNGTTKGRLMVISEYSYYRLYRVEEQRLERDLERRRMAQERKLEKRRLQRAERVSDASGTIGVCAHAVQAQH